MLDMCSLAAAVLEDAMAALRAHREAAAQEAGPQQPQQQLSIFELRVRGGSEGPHVPCTPRLLRALHGYAVVMLSSCVLL